MKIGIFGGTFDPVHKGHIRAAEAFVKEVRLDKLSILPNFIPPLKHTDHLPADGKDRLNMIKTAFSGLKNTVIDDYELKNEGISYTYMTLKHYKKLFPDSEIYLMIGDDNLLVFDKWKNYEYILGNCTLCVSARSGADITDIKKRFEAAFNADIKILEFTPMRISSKQLRKNLDKHYLPEGVYEYILDKGLYK